MLKLFLKVIQLATSSVVSHPEDIAIYLSMLPFSLGEQSYQDLCKSQCDQPQCGRHSLPGVVPRGSQGPGEKSTHMLENGISNETQFLKDSVLKYSDLNILQTGSPRISSL